VRRWAGTCHDSDVDLWPNLLTGIEQMREPCALILGKILIFRSLTFSPNRWDADRTGLAPTATGDMVPPSRAGVCGALRRVFAYRV
jgi:hypothetical protein